jgi:hypothetical protein
MAATMTVADEETMKRRVKTAGITAVGGAIAHARSGPVPTGETRRGLAAA